MAPISDDGASIEALAAAVHEPVERVRHWTELGLLAGQGANSPADAMERARLVSFAVRSGIAADAIARLSAEDDIIGRFVALIDGDESRQTHTLQDAAAASGLDESTVRRLWVASGLGDQPAVYDEDIAMLRALAFALDTGMPLDALVQLTRVFNDALTRVAEAETRLFHFYVHERLRGDGLTGAELEAATTRVSAPLLDLVEPAVLYFHRKAWQRGLREDFVLHLTDDVAADGDVGRLRVAVLFVDLASFTPMTEAMGDAVAASVIERFSDLVREAAIESDGRVLKQIGDEFMLVFPSPFQAVACGRSIMTKAAGEHEFPDVRLGAHAGTALYREGDYVGSTVNVAARVASQATGGEFLVTDAIRAGLAGSGTELTAVGRRVLRGVSEAVELFEIAPPRQARPMDPVCGMILHPDRCAVGLDWRGTRRFFCSDACRDRFVADPDRYGHGAWR